MSSMDTRSKIVDTGALPQGRLCLVSAYFDPLLPWHAERFAELSEPGLTLVAVVLPRDDELLPQRARAELAAALRVIDYVLIAPIASFPEGARMISLAEEDLVRRAQLIDDVRSRPIR